MPSVQPRRWVPPTSLLHTRGPCSDRELAVCWPRVLAVPYAGCALQTLWRLDCSAKPPLHVSPHAHVLKGACVASNTACAGSGSAATHCVPLPRTRSATPPTCSQHAVCARSARCQHTTNTLLCARSTRCQHIPNTPFVHGQHAVSTPAHRQHPGSTRPADCLLVLCRCGGPAQCGDHGRFSAPPLRLTWGSTPPLRLT